MRARLLLLALVVAMLTLPLALAAEDNSTSTTPGPSPTPTETPSPTPAPNATQTPEPTPTPEPRPDVYSSQMILQLDVPAKVVVKFVRPLNFKLGNISAVGATNYLAQQTPTSFTFETNDTDAYKFQLTLIYEEPQPQTLVIGAFGNQKLDQYYPKVVAKEVTLSFEVTTKQPISFPTKDEIVEGVINQVKQELSDFTGTLDQSIRVIDRNSNTYGMIGLASLLGLGIVVGAFFLYQVPILQERRKESVVRTEKIAELASKIDGLGNSVDTLKEKVDAFVKPQKVEPQRGSPPSLAFSIKHLPKIPKWLQLEMLVTIGIWLAVIAQLLGGRL